MNSITPHKFTACSKDKYKTFLALFILLNFILWSILYFRQSYIFDSLDFYYHNLFSRLIFQEGYQIAYPGYHVIVGGLSYITGLPTTITAIPILVVNAMVYIYLSYILLQELIFGHVLKKQEEKYTVESLGVLLLAFLLNIVQPMIWFTIPPGYSSGNGYVSPTQAFCKTFVLLSLIVFYRSYRNQTWNIKNKALLTLFLIISCIIKPMYAMAFVPSMGILLFMDKVKDIQHKKAKVLDAALQYMKDAMPLLITGIFLIAQYIYSTNMPEYAGGLRSGTSGDTHIRLGFLYSWNIVVENVWISILFAYFFPIVLLMIAKVYQNKKPILSKNLIPFAKMTFYYVIVSFLYVSCLYQDNGYEADLNFRNSWVVSFIMVYALCLSILYGWIKENNFIGSLKQTKQTGVESFVQNQKKVLVALLALSVHILFGALLLLKTILVGN